jgi:hypothetical protein
MLSAICLREQGGWPTRTGHTLVENPLQRVFANYIEDM